MTVTVLQPGASMLERLRDATASAHEALHVHPALRDLTAAGVTRSYYIRAIERFHGFHAPLERALVQSPPLPGLESFQQQTVTPRLAADLIAAGVEPGSVPQRAAPPALDPAAIVAYLYLREGSALGGQLIARSLQNHLGLAPAETQFFTGLGKQTALRWRGFCTALADVPAVPDPVAQAARELFGALAGWLGEEA